MTGIFISYRREQDTGAAHALYLELSRHFGAEQVFRDAEALEPGLDFVKAIETAVGRCAVVVAFIGPGWANTTNATGERGLDDPRDFVRLELAAALRRDIRVIPILVRGGAMPRAVDLPSDLSSLAQRQAVTLGAGRWRDEVAPLIRALEDVLGPGEPDPSEVARLAAPSLLCVATRHYLVSNPGMDLDVPDNFYPGGVQVTEHHEGVNAFELDQVLRGKFDLVHVLGYIDQTSGALIVGDRDDTIDYRGVAALLARTRARLVILNVCDSLALAARVARTSNMIASTGAIPHHRFRRWAATFYDGLGRGWPLSHAYESATNVSGTSDNMVLLMKRDFAIPSASGRDSTL